MAKKKDRDCLECMGYCNMLDDDDYRCGLGIEWDIEDVLTVEEYDAAIW